MNPRRKFLAGAGAALIAAPFATKVHSATSRHIRVGTILAGTTMAAQLLPKYLKERGVEVEVISFTNLTQLMQAMAAGNIQVGYGGINAAIAMAGRNVPVSLLANACEGGWRMVGKPEIKSLADLSGKQVAVQTGNMCHVALAWKIKELGIKDVELVFMVNSDMPTPMQRGQVDAIFGIEPYPSFAVANGWATEIWRGYDTPVGRVNLGLLGSTTFTDKNPELTRHLLASHRAATEELAGNPTAAGEFIATQLNMSRPIVDESLKNIYFTADSGPELTSKVRVLGDMMREAGLTDRLPQWDAFFRTDLMSQA